MSIEAILLSVLTVCFGGLGFLLARLINRNDKFQDDTTKSIGVLKVAVSKQEVSITTLQNTLYKKIELSGFDQKTKTKISSLNASLAQIEKDLVKIKPIVENAQQDQGKIIFIQERLEAQDKKLAGLYKIALKVFNDQKN